MLVLLVVLVLPAAAMLQILAPGPNNGSVVLRAIHAPHYVFAGSPFAVTAPLSIVPDAFHSSYQLPSSARGCIVVVDYFLAGDAYEWAVACKAVGCSGIVFHNTSINGVGYWDAAAFWIHSKPFTDVPAVISHIETDVDDFAFITAMVQSTPGLKASITSGDDNPAIIALRSPAVYILLGTACLISFLNILYAILQLLRFSYDEVCRFRLANPGPLTVICLEMIASINRFLITFHMSLFGSTLLPFYIQRYVITSCISFSYMGTIALSYIFYGILRGPKTTSKPRRFVTIAIGIFIIALFAFEQITTIMSAVATHEFYNSSRIGAMYFLISLPIVYSFIFHGGKLVKSLQAAQENTGALEDERARALLFAKRIKTSGTAGFLMSLSLILFAMFNSTSLWVWLVLYSIVQILQAIICTVHISAFRSTPSYFDFDRPTFFSFHHRNTRKITPILK